MSTGTVNKKGRKPAKNAQPELSESEKHCLAAIIELKQASGGDSPSYLEIGEKIDFTEAYVGRLVESLRAKGRLAPDEGKRRSLKVLKAS